MALTNDQADLIRALERKHSQDRVERERLRAYYEGSMRLEALGLSLPPELERLQTVVDWPPLTVNTLEERLRVEDFRVAGQEKSEELLWEWWQANDMDEEAPLAHVECMAFRYSYVTVSINEDDPEVPLTRVESPAALIHDVDPRTREITAVARFYDVDSSTGTGRARRATLYLPDRTVHLTRKTRRMGAAWDTEEIDEHDLGEVPVVVHTNNIRLQDRAGRSEMSPVITLTDAACRALTNLQAAQEFYAVPSRYVFGVTPEDFQTQDGKPVTQWEAYIGRFNTLSDPSGTITQLPASDLQNFGNVITMYSKLVSSVTGLPSHYLGYSTDNPISADAIAGAESRLVKCAETKHRQFSGGWEKWARISHKLVRGNPPESWKRLETVWADPAHPTTERKAQSVLALFQAGVITREAVWEELGYSAEKQRRLAEQFRRQDPLRELLSADPDQSGLKGPMTAQTIGGTGHRGRDADSDGIVGEPR